VSFSHGASSNARDFDLINPPFFGPLQSSVRNGFPRSSAIPVALFPRIATLIATTKPGFYYGQRQQQSEKRSQKAKEGKAESSRHAQDELS
jgi:hypothetical protein